MAKIQNIQALRGVAVLSVVCYHLLTIEQKYGGAQTILPPVLQFGMFGVDLFFVISGFVMVTVTRGKFTDAQESWRFLYRRVARIYPTYWVYSLVVLGVFLFQPTWVNSAQNNEVDILASFLLWPAPTLPLVMVGWTLIHEIYFYLIFFVITLFVAERYLVVALVLWGGVLTGCQLLVASTTPLLNLLCHPLTLEFIGGCILARIYFNSTRMVRPRHALVLAGLCFVAAVAGLFLFQNITGTPEPAGWYRLLLFGLPALVIVGCFLWAERAGRVLHVSLIRVGDASYSIYLSHILTLSAAGRLWSLVASDRMVDNVFMLPLLIILVLVVGFVSYKLIEKPLLRVSRKVA